MSNIILHIINIQTISNVSKDTIMTLLFHEYETQITFMKTL
jgi:hypothetical protein